MKRPQYVFRPNLNEPQHRRAWALLQQVPPAKRKEFLVQSILAAEQTDRLVFFTVYIRIQIQLNYIVITLTMTQILFLLKR